MCSERNVCSLECALLALKLLFLFILMVWIIISFKYFVKPAECKCENCANKIDLKTQAMCKKMRITEDYILIDFVENKKN